MVFAMRNLRKSLIHKDLGFDRARAASPKPLRTKDLQLFWENWENVY